MEDRWAAVLSASKEMDKQDLGCLKFVNGITVRLCNDDFAARRVLVICNESHE